MSESNSDEYWMQLAIALAQRAAEEGEVPVGAVIVAGNERIAEGWNRPIADHDPTAHAEIMAIRAAAAKVGNYRLPGHRLYVTLEPCVMCAGAIVHARLDAVIYGAADPRAGADRSVYDVLSAPKLNHAPAVRSDVLAGACGDLLRDFFRARR